MVFYSLKYIITAYIYFLFFTTNYHEKVDQTCVNIRYQNVDRTTSFNNIETCKNRTLISFLSKYFIRFNKKS